MKWWPFFRQEAPVNHAMQERLQKAERENIYLQSRVKSRAMDHAITADAATSTLKALLEEVGKKKR